MNRRPHRTGGGPEGGPTMNQGQLWLAPVRNMTWVAAHFGHR
jgi:hypothetical protein